MAISLPLCDLNKGHFASYVGCIMHREALRGLGKKGRFLAVLKGTFVTSVCFPTHQIPSEKATLKGKNLLPSRADSFLIEQIFSEGRQN